MSSKSAEIRKFSGLHAQANSFDVPDGAMETCSNVEIQSDSVITKTHGWYKYYTGTSAIKALVTYQNRLISISDSIRYFNTAVQISTDSVYSPIYSPVTLTSTTFSPLSTTRTSQQNNNLYFTSTSGIQKLEAYTSASRKAGVPPGLELYVESGTGETGPLAANSQTAFRVVFGRRDTNLNLLLSAPSDIATVGTPAGATGATYASVGAGPYTITVTTATAHSLRVGDRIIVSSATDIDANGITSVTLVPSTLTFQYSVPANPLSGTLNYTFTRNAILYFTIPSEINSTTDMWFYQVYRTTSSASLSVSPSPDFALISELALTATNISNGFVTVVDDVDSLVLGAELYTNPNSREGELQANARPPLARDITVYKNYSLYSNIYTKQRIFSTLVNPLGIIANSQVIFTYNGTTETYIAKQTDVGNRSVTGTASGFTTIVITYTAHGASNGYVVQIESAVGVLPTGNYTIFAVTANTFSITSTGNTATSVVFAFKTDGTNPIFYSDVVSASLAVRIANTAFHLVKAINRNSALMYANYTSGFDDAPGNMRFELKSFDTVGANLYMRMAVASPQPFLPPVPTSFVTGQQVSSESDNYPDGIFISKLFEPEAVPVVNFIRVGAQDKAIMRIFALRDAVIILKEDGIFKITGDTINQFSVTLIDSTVSVETENGAALINNFVMALSNQGVVSITDSSVQIVSHRIDDLIMPLAAFSGDGDQFTAFGYEEGKSWYLSQSIALNGVPANTYVYNVANQTWSTTTQLFTCMGLGPDRTIYIGTEDAALTPIIKRQRRSFALTDYSSEYAVGTSYATGTKSAYIQMVSGNIFVPVAGDVVLQNAGGAIASTIINRIASVAVSGAGYLVTFANVTTISTTPSDAVNFYQGFQSDIKFSPFHAGEVGREKLFSQFQVHMRQQSITNLNISFTTADYSAIGNSEWDVLNISETAAFDTQGWGYDPWGSFAWGQSSAQDISLQFGTQPSVIVRTLVPLSAARSTFIQALLGNRQACEGLFIQSISYLVRGYGERVSR